MVREKKIPHFKIGRKIFFLPEVLENWIKKQGV
ncbi:helix-turn-helix domain-containing protein [Virgibacillus sp. SK37]|nr:helix-turn-helix domain-containing protein [Virgibacillus sp. SK37]